jgi:hypothetical protein
MGKTPERKPGEFKECGDVYGGAGICDDGQAHKCCLDAGHKDPPQCLCGKCGQKFI